MLQPHRQNQLAGFCEIQSLIPNCCLLVSWCDGIDKRDFHCFYMRLAGPVEDEPQENSNCSFQSKHLLRANVSQDSYKEITKLQII